MIRSFSETQRFNQWYFILLVLVCISVIVNVAIVTIPKIQNNPTELTLFIGANLIGVLLLIGVFTLTLKTEINEQGIFFNFWPIQRKKRHIPWKEINRVYVRKYRPITEYGGWGMRLKLGKYGKAYNVSGTIGIQIEFKNGEKTLIGTKKKKDAEDVLNYYKNKVI